jgi:energy-coupling factor transporter ATP-binding protein EcfA2
VLILDEPTAGLDPKQIIETRKLIKELAGDHTIVLSTHILPEVEEVVVVGLALDYCVKSTAIDAYNLGFNSTVVLAGTKAVNVNPDDGDKAVEEMKDLGIKVQ